MQISGSVRRTWKLRRRLSKEVPPLLKSLREDHSGAQPQDIVDFLVVLEDIVTSALLEEPDERPGLKSSSQNWTNTTPLG